MRTRSIRVALATLGGCWAVAATPAVAADRLDPLRQYTVTGATAAELAAAGFDMRETHRTRGGQLIVATAAQAAALEAKGADVKGFAAAAGAVAAPDPRTDPDARLRRLPALEPHPRARARARASTR